MNRYRLAHVTAFNYDGIVSDSYNVVRLRPRDDQWQTCLSFKLQTTPESRASAYLDNWGNPALAVPHGAPCSRLEGRINTGSRNPQGNTCDMGAFPQKLNVSHRRYVIDETIGAVSIFHNFPWLDAGLPVDPGTPASQMFRVEGGKKRYIHEVTVGTTPKCGRGK